MALAEILERLQRDGAKGSTVATLGDKKLATRVRSAARRQGIEPDQFLVRAIQAFERHATDEEWIALFWIVARNGRPGTTSFRLLIERALLHADNPAQRRSNGSNRPLADKAMRREAS
jgi:hypothetical protein